MSHLKPFRSHLEPFGRRQGDGSPALTLYDNRTVPMSAWGLTYNETSISNNREYISVIYKKGDGYKYTDPFDSTGDNANSSVDINSDIACSAIVHSHAAYDELYDNENFSQTDKDTSNRFAVPMFVVTPGGYLKKYNPNKWIFKTSTLSDSMPSDPNSPD